MIARPESVDRYMTGVVRDLPVRLPVVVSNSVDGIPRALRAEDRQPPAAAFEEERIQRSQPAAGTSSASAVA